MACDRFSLFQVVYEDYAMGISENCSQHFPADGTVFVLFGEPTPRVLTVLLFLVFPHIWSVRMGPCFNIGRIVHQNLTRFELELLRNGHMILFLINCEQTRYLTRLAFSYLNARTEY